VRPFLPTIAAGAALVLSGCATAPPVDLRLPAAYETAAAPSDSTLGLDRWWTNFNDPLLTALIDRALERNLDARTALARLEEARATRSAALTGFLPQGDPSGSATRTRGDSGGAAASSVTRTDAANFDVSWQVDLFGRFGAARSTANADLAAERFAFEGARANVAASVADAYFQARGLAIQLADARETERVQQDLYDLATRKARRGLVASGEADRVAGDLSQSTARVASLQAELQTQKRALLILVGRVVEPTEAIEIAAGVGQAPQVPTSLPSALLIRRPDVREAQARLASAVGQTQLANLAFLPTFTLVPGAGWSKSNGSGTQASAATWTLGAAVSQPVLDIPRLLSQRRVSKARATQAALAYEKAIQTAFSESEGALVRLQADRRQVEVLAEGEVRAQRAYRYACNNYVRGVNDLEATLSAEQAWRATRTQLTTAQVQALRRAVQAYQALGGGWPADTLPTMANAR
jgi:NodT family efflux transporter outer membrane factor (OMF) lipoprotein